MTMVWAFFTTQLCQLGHDHCNLYFETSHFCQFDMILFCGCCFLSLFLNCMIFARRKQKKEESGIHMWDLSTFISPQIQV